MNKKMIHIKQQSNIFCDAFVANDTGILFASIWGRNTSLQQFLARMELPDNQGGISELTFETSEEISQTFVLQNVKNMQKLSGRIPETIYGNDLSHIFIYDKSTASIDYGAYKATVLYLNDTQIDDKAVWRILKELSPIPLLDIWMAQIINLCHREDYIDKVNGFGDISALIIQLNEADFECFVSNMIKNQTLLVA